MSTKLLRAAMPHRFVALVVAALFGLTLALVPISAPEANAAVSARTSFNALRVARNQIGIRYVWGGTTRRGFDCSGLSQYSYAKVGKRIPRTAQQQYKASIRIRRSQARWGDLVFFPSGGRMHHMGLYAGRGWMIHAPRTGKRVSKVRIWTSRVVFGRVR
jgi:cell wall-associated NlpC family hydrolase